MTINVLSKAAPVYFANDRGFDMAWVQLPNEKIIPVSKTLLRMLEADKTGKYTIVNMGKVDVIVEATNDT